MATTTLGRTTPEVNTLGTNRAIYWGLLAALAILLIFAFTASRNSTVVTPATVQSMDTPAVTPMNTPVERSVDTAPAMDSTPMNSINSAAPYDEAPNGDVVNPDGLNRDPAVMQRGTMEPGTSVSPDAPKGTVVR